MPRCLTFGIRTVFSALSRLGGMTCESGRGRVSYVGLKIPRSRLNKHMPASPDCGNHPEDAIDSIFLRASSGATASVSLAACSWACHVGVVVKRRQCASLIAWASFQFVRDFHHSIKEIRLNFVSSWPRSASSCAAVIAANRPTR